MCMSCVWPHFRCIRIGKKFQAEIPELQERPAAETSEHGASLVWKPSDDVMGHPETQDRGGWDMGPNSQGYPPFPHLQGVPPPSPHLDQEAVSLGGAPGCGTRPSPPAPHSPHAVTSQAILSRCQEQGFCPSSLSFPSLKVKYGSISTMQLYFSEPSCSNYSYMYFIYVCVYECVCI